jgi:hypothetical protein
MVVVIRKEILDPMGLRETALFIKAEDGRTVPGSDKQGFTIRVMGAHEFDQCLPIYFSLTDGLNPDVLELIGAVRFHCNQAFSFHTVVIQNEHFAAFEILIHHAFLLIRQQ